MTRFYSALIHDAMEFAAEKHDGQYRKNPDTIPYISHPAAVGIILAQADFDEEVIAASLLHDMLEDCGVTHQQLADRFGEHVATLVQQVTEQKDVKDWIERKRLYREGLKNAELDALAIACADHLHNVNSFIHTHNADGGTKSSFKGISMEHRIDNERGCREIFNERLDHPLAQEFDQALQQFEAMLQSA